MNSRGAPRSAGADREDRIPSIRGVGVIGVREGIGWPLLLNSGSEEQYSRRAIYNRVEVRTVVPPEEQIGCHLETGCLARFVTVGGSQLQHGIGSELQELHYENGGSPS